MTNCWFCGTEMVWSSDFNFEDYNYQGEGTVSRLSCPNCESVAEFTTKRDDNYSNT